MLKDQPKWRMTHDPPNSASGSSKRSNPKTKDAGNKAVGRSQRPKGRKAVKRRIKEKDNNIVVDLVTS